MREDRIIGIVRNVNAAIVALDIDVRGPAQRYVGRVVDHLARGSEIEVSAREVSAVFVLILEDQAAEIGEQIRALRPN